MKLDAIPNAATISAAAEEDSSIAGKPRLRWMLGVIAFVIAATVLALYFVLHQAGNPAANPAPSHAENAQAEPAPNAQTQQIQAMVEQLARRLEKDPDNGSGWQMLGKSYAVLGRFDDSVKAYSRAAALLPADAGLLADYADVLVMARSGNFQGEPAQLIRKALEIDPQHPKVLALAGTEAFKRNDFKAALRYWNKVLEVVPADSELAVSMRNAIADAKNRRGASAENSGR